MDRIYNQISKSDIIIADMTNRNANVFYEVGYAHGIGKNVILLTKNPEDIPFDFKHFPHIIYDGQIKLLSEQLKRKLQWFLDQEEGVKNPLPDFGLEFLIDGQKIEEGKCIELSEKQLDTWESAFKIRIDIFNASSKTFVSKFSLGMEMVKAYEGLIRGLESLKPSPEAVMYVSKDFSNIYPSAYKSLEFSLEDIRTREKNTLVDIKLKVFTAFEMKEILFSLLFAKIVDPLGW